MTSPWIWSGDVSPMRTASTQPFAIDEAARQRLLNGLDDIALILQHEAAIAAYELAHGDGVVGTRR